MTIGNMKNVSTLSLNLNREDSGITNLDDLYYLPNLSELNVYSLNLENVNGLKYMNKLNKLTFNKCNISDFSGMRYLSNCTYIFVVEKGIDNENIGSFFESIKNLRKLEDLKIETMYSKLTDVEKINIGLSSMASKNTLKKLSLFSNCISGILDVKGFTNLESLELSNNYYISGINNLKDCKNLRSISLSNNSFVDVSQLNYFKEGIKYYIYLAGNSSLDTSKIIANSSLFTKAADYKIDSKYAQYIEGIKNIDYSTSGDGGDIVDGTIEYIPDSVTTVSLNNCKKLTNIDFLLNKTNITILNMQNCIGISQEEFKKVMSTLVNLKSLNIKNCTQLTDISFLKEANIKSLYIAGCPNITDISWINTDTMGSLDLSNSGVKFLSSELENTKKLNNLTISYLTINADVDPTLIQTAISNLQIYIVVTGSDTEKIQWNKKLSNCTEISSLRMCYFNWSAITKMDLSKCTKLKTLSLSNLEVGENFEIDISNCSELTKITFDSISSRKHHFKVPNLSNCNKLENIVIKNAYMTNEEFNNMCMQLSNATNLKSVDLSYNSISDMSGISHLKNSKLTYLSLMNNNISIVSGIDEMQYLNQLVLKNNNLDIVNKSLLNAP